MVKFSHLDYAKDVVVPFFQVHFDIKIFFSI